MREARTVLGEGGGGEDSIAVEGTLRFDVDLSAGEKEWDGSGVAA